MLSRRDRGNDVGVVGFLGGEAELAGCAWVDRSRGCSSAGMPMLR